MDSSRNPFRELERMFERLSGGFEEGPFGQDWGGDREATSVDVAEYDDEIVVTADLPGYDRENIDVSLAGNQLRITAQQLSTAGDESATYHRRERRQRRVSRTVRLPEPVDEEDVSATYRNGVLTVTLPKTHPEEDGRSIEIE